MGSPLCCFPSCAFSSMSEKKKKQKQETPVAFTKRDFFPHILHVTNQSHLELPPLWARQWCTWSQCMRRSALDPEWRHTTQLFPSDHSHRHEHSMWASCLLTMSTSSFHSGCGKTMTTGCESWDVKEMVFFLLLQLMPSPCPPPLPTGPTQRSALQQWPSGSLLSLDPTVSEKINVFKATATKGPWTFKYYKET